MDERKSDDQTVHPPRVFVSYSHDSAAHRASIRALADRLRREGVDCHIDLYYSSPAQGWPQWMADQIELADFVLAVCTERYRRRFEHHEEPGKGPGATWEGAILTLSLYEGATLNARVIPIALTRDQVEHRPLVLRSTTYYVLDTEEGYEDLYRRLTNQPRIVAPNLGTLRVLPSEAGQEFAAARFPDTQGSATAKRPDLHFWLRDEGEQRASNGRVHRVVSLVVTNNGTSGTSEFMLALQLPFMPPNVSKPIDPERVVRPLLAAAPDRQGWRSWKPWTTQEEGRDVFGVTLVNSGDLSVFPGPEFVFCQFFLPVGWFGPEPKSVTYHCRYSFSSADVPNEQGALDLELFELPPGFH